MPPRPKSSVLRQLIEGADAPLPHESAQPAAPQRISPAAVPTTTRIEPAPTAATAAPRADTRETAPRTVPGLAGYLKILAENAPVAMAIFDTQMRYLYANQRWLEVFKLDQTEIVSRSQYEVFPSLHPGWRHVYERALAGQVVRSDRDTVNQAGQPVLYRWEVRPWRHADTTVGGVMITCLCIAGMRAKDAVEGAAQGEIAPLAAVSSSGIWSLPLPLLALDASGRVCRAGTEAGGMFLSAGLREGQTLFWQLFAGRSAGRELRGPTLAALQAVLSGAERSVLLDMPLAPSSEPGTPPSAWHFTKISARASGLEQDAVLAVGLNLPEGRAPVMPLEPTVIVQENPALAAELARLKVAVKDACDTANVSRVRESRLRAVLDSVPCGLLLLDERGRVVFYNERATALLGAPAAEGQSVEDWLAQSCRDEQQREEVVRQWREGVWRKQLKRTISLTTAEGWLRDVELHPASLPGGGMLVMTHDVTDDRRAEELLRATEAKFRTLVHENPLPVVLTDRSGAVFEANAAAEAMLGLTRAELRRMALDEWLTPDSLTERSKALREMIQRGDLYANVSVEIRHREGGTAPASLRIATVPDAAGGPAATVQFFRLVDNTPTGRAASIFTALDDEPPAPPPLPVLPPGKVLLSTDAHGRVTQWSEAAMECFGLSKEEAMGRGLHTLFRPSDATGFYAEILQHGESGGSMPVEWAFFHPNYGRMTGKFVLMPQDPGSLSIALMTDGTDSQVRTPFATEAPAVPVQPGISVQAMQERERMLLGEAHHRVKNHLQIITSMLNLQLSTLHHDDAKEALRSSQNRVRSIASLHQHLYSLAMGEAGSFADFAAGLITHLRECYEVSEDRVPVELKVPSATVPEEWLMPLALSLNEMVSNAFKHAYAGGRRGRMKIELRLENERGELTVQDDGAGLPQNFDDHKCGGLGLKIMRVFAGQLGGEVHVDSGPGQGVSFRLQFPLTPKEA